MLNSGIGLDKFDVDLSKFNLLNFKDLIKKKFSYNLMKNLFESYYSNILFNDRVLLEVCEMYKIATNEEILKSLDPNDEHMVFFDKEFVDLKFYHIKDKVHELGFYFKSYNSIDNVVELVTSMDNVNNNRVSIHFPETKVVIKAMTPLNYRLFKGEELSYIFNPLVLFFRIIADAIEMKCTDVHFQTFKLTANKSTYPIEYRIGNNLVSRNLFNIDSYLNESMIKEVIKNKTNYVTTDLKSMKGITDSILDPFFVGGNDLRINVSKTISGFKTTVRIMGASDLVKDISNLGFRPKVNEVLERVTRVNNGMTLVTGPMRSGKNTTLFAILNKMKDRPINIFDISSPTETLLPINQINYENNVDHLKSVISSCKKHDLNVAHINELPNKDVADSIYDLVNSSVAVLTTFHINRIWHLCYKIKEYFQENTYNIFTHLNYVFNQKIFIKQCPHCQETFSLTDKSNLFPEVMELCLKFGISSYKVSKGCSRCDYTGVLPGIQPYVEYIIVDDSLRRKLFKAQNLYEMEMVIYNVVKEQGTSLEDFVIEDVKLGILHPNQLVNLL